MVVSNGQRGGNFKGSKHQRSKPKKQDAPKQDGGFLEWLVPPLAIAKIARQKRAKRRRAMMQRRRRERMMMMRQERRPTNYRESNGYRYARPRTSRNFYINVSNNSSRNNSKQQLKQLKPATTNQTDRPWVNRRRSQVGQSGGIVADERKLARQAMRHNLQYYKRMKQ